MRRRRQKKNAPARIRRAPTTALTAIPALAPAEKDLLLAGDALSETAAGVVGEGFAVTLEVLFETGLPDELGERLVVDVVELDMIGSTIENGDDSEFSGVTPSWATQASLK